MIDKYVKSIIQEFKTGKTTEHSFRGYLKDLVEEIGQNVQVINEPQRIKCGAPDYIVQRNNIPIGYIEAKDIAVELSTIEKTDQLKRYLSSLDNLILTNYLEFWFYVSGEKVSEVKIADIDSKSKIIPYPDQYDILLDHISNFCLYSGTVIKSPIHLANLMAQKAVMIRDIIVNSLTNGSETSLHSQMQGFKEVLISDLTPHTFADIYAQTIAYGMFVARLNCQNSKDFSRQSARELVSKSNPFLRKFFDYISGANLDDSLIWIVDDLVDIFKHVDLIMLLKDYGKDTQTSDPFLHFYETFLSFYDKEGKVKRGVYYTPQPIVEFIVSAVDDILKKEFKLKNGMADDSTVKRKKSKNDASTVKSKELSEFVYKVKILDPATGTGTFLSEVVRKIYSYFEDKKGIWSEYVDKKLLSRLYGFEILMTPYVMCHLKLDLMLKSTGYVASDKTARFKVYLTNTLDSGETSRYPLMLDWLASEAYEASQIKRDTPIMVVMGNPPYSVSSCNKNEYIEDLISVYKQGLNEKNIQPLSDDYIKFIRRGEKFIEDNNEGILAYISNNSFLDGIIHRTMRLHLMQTFDKIYILDLHGNSRKQEIAPDGSKDENVFDIMQGVSINIFVKTSNKKSNTLAKVYHADLYGTRENKFSFLKSHNLDTAGFIELNPVAPYYFFVPKDFSAQREYEKGVKISDLFSLYNSCIQTQCNDASIGFTPSASSISFVTGTG